MDPIRSWPKRRHRYDGAARRKGEVLRTKRSTCSRKLRFAGEADALAAAQKATISLRIYRCDRCRQFHLTSRTKGKWMPRQPA